MAWTPHSRQLEQPLHPIAMSCIRFEQLGQAVVIHLGAGQRPTDVCGHVVVTEADRIRIAERRMPHLGSGPDPDPRYGAQPSVCLVTGQVHALLQPARDAHGPNDGRRPPAVDPGCKPLPRRDPRPSAGTGGDPQATHATFSGCALAVAADKGAIGTGGLLTGDLLRDDRGDQRLQHQPGPGHSPSAEPSCRLGDLPVVRDKARRVVQVAEAARRFSGWRVPRTGLVLESLIPSIIAQKVTGQEASGSYRALVCRYGERAPGEGGVRGLWVAPSARGWR